jgi:RHS repeat-associated protein
VDPLRGPIHADGIGSIRRLTDEAGAITDGYTTTSFGELISHTGTDPQPYLFAGESYDPNVGFAYHRERWYAPSTGRFVGMDPYGGNEFDPPSLHRYLYADADPVSNTDPSGRFTLPSLATISSVLSTINTISLLSTAAVFGYRAGTIANDLLIEEKIELEEALDEAKDLGGDLALSIAAYRFLNFEGLKFAGSLMRKLPSMVGRIKIFNIAQVNGRLAEHYIGNAYGLFRNTVKIGGRTPDFLTSKVLREIKNVIELRWSGRVAAQLRDYAAICKQTGRQFYIHVRPGTKVDPRVEAELLQRFGPGSRGVLWDIIADVPESLRVIP